MSSRPHRLPVMALLTGAVLFCAGCETQDKKQPPPAPSDLQPRLVTLALHALMDEDRNGFPDTLPVAVYLWDDRYPLPIWHEGSLTFELRTQEQGLLADWTVPPEIVFAARRRDQVGAVHVLSLDIREAISDELPPTATELSARFTGKDGQEASTMRPLVVRLGR